MSSAQARPVGQQVPAEVCAFADAVEESLLEAAACGDAGFLDRVFTCRDDEVGAPGRPADPLDVLGAVGWLGLASRERNQSDARFLAAIHVVGHYDGARDDAGYRVRDGFALDEVAAAQGWSVSMAGSWLSLAEAVIDRLPRVFEAMSAGSVDIGKARTIVEHSRAMPADLAGLVVSMVLEGAPRVSHSELAEQIGVIAGGPDPVWAARREKAARARVRLEATRNPEGTADLALRDLDAESGARIRARIEALALAVQRAGRAAGCRVGIGLARAFVAARLWDGSSVGLDDDALVAGLVEELPAWLAELRDTDDADEIDDANDTDPDDESDSDDDGPDDDGPDDGGPDDGAHGDDREAGGARVGTVELRLRLGTALELDDLPAEVVGQGPLPARSARRMLERTRRGRVPVECRLVLVDADGRLEHVVLVPLEPPPGARPPGPRDRKGRRGRPRGRVIVELAAATTILCALDPDDHPAWARWLRRAQLRLTTLVTPTRSGRRVDQQHPATSRRDAHRRFAGRELDRWTRARDRQCLGPTCTAAAHDAQLDHTRDWTRLGATVAGNLGALCAHCHRLKHDGAWRLEQPAPGRFVWRTRHGATYTVDPRPVLDPRLVDPRLVDPRLEPAPRPVRAPRPVTVHRRTPRPGPDGWAHRRTRLTVPAEVPAPPPRPGRLARRDHRDDPPPPF